MGRQPCAKLVFACRFVLRVALARSRAQPNHMHPRLSLSHAWDAPTEHIRATQRCLPMHFMPHASAPSCVWRDDPALPLPPRVETSSSQRRIFSTRCGSESPTLLGPQLSSAQISSAQLTGPWRGGRSSPSPSITVTVSKLKRLWGRCPFLGPREGGRGDEAHRPHRTIRHAVGTTRTRTCRASQTRSGASKDVEKAHEGLLQGTGRPRIEGSASWSAEEGDVVPKKDGTRNHDTSRNRSRDGDTSHTGERKGTKRSRR